MASKGAPRHPRTENRDTFEVPLGAKILPTAGAIRSLRRPAANSETHERHLPAL
jgi:hypothetical protein